MHIEKCQPNIGAEIGGVDLSKPLDAKTREELRLAWLKHKVVFFRDQQLTREQHLALGREFGELEVHPVPELRLPNYPELLPIQSTPKVKAAANWHSDVSYLACPPMGAILRAIVLPEMGGDTLWVNMVAAYAGLPEGIRERIETLQAVHSPNFQNYVNAVDDVSSLEGQHAQRTHPVVRIHPETGERILYVNDSFTTELVGLGREESGELLHLLRDQARRPEYQVRFSWRPNSIAFWDNRATQHYAVPDFYGHRYLERVTLKGDKPIGVEREKEIIDNRSVVTE